MCGETIKHLSLFLEPLMSSVFSIPKSQDHLLVSFCFCFCCCCLLLLFVVVVVCCCCCWFGVRVSYLVSLA